MSNSYELLDSGNGEKLERFGKIIIRRPSSVCIWKPREKELWGNADASFEPKAAIWKVKKGQVQDLIWETVFADSKLILRLQDNGQVGVFPEHASYLPKLANSFAHTEVRPLRVLNLFAFTGLATLFFRSKKAEVTHVDLSKKVIGWAKDNMELQSSELGTLPPVRWICEDAVAFLKREVRRDSQYDGIIIDPPSFSRITKNDFWKVADILQELVECCSALLKKHGQFLALTCHDPGISAPMLGNLVLDNFNRGRVEPLELSIPEKNTLRTLPAGSSALWLA